MRLKITLVYATLLLCLSAAAQMEEGQTASSSNDTAEHVKYSGWALTYSPSALINIYTGVQFGVERSLESNKFLELEAAYLLKNGGGSELYRSGYRFKLGYKVITEQDVLLSTVLYFRKTFHQHREEVIRQSEFIEEIEYRKTKTLIGPTMGVGHSSYFSNRLNLQTSILFGPGIYKVKVYDYPEDAEQIRLLLFQGYSDEGNYFYPILGFSIKLIYRLGLR